MAKVLVTVSADGRVELEFAGFAGQACDAEKQRLLQLLAQLGVESEGEGFRRKMDAPEGVRGSNARESSIGH